MGRKPDTRVSESPTQLRHRVNSAIDSLPSHMDKVVNIIDIIQYDVCGCELLGQGLNQNSRPRDEEGDWTGRLED